MPTWPLTWLMWPPSGLSCSTFHTGFIKIINHFTRGAWKFLRPLKMLRFGDVAPEGQEVLEWLSDWQSRGKMPDGLTPSRYDDNWEGSPSFYNSSWNVKSFWKCSKVRKFDAWFQQQHSLCPHILPNQPVTSKRPCQMPLEREWDLLCAP